MSLNLITPQEAKLIYQMRGWDGIAEIINGSRLSAENAEVLYRNTLDSWTSGHVAREVHQQSGAEGSNPSESTQINYADTLAKSGAEVTLAEANLTESLEVSRVKSENLLGAHRLIGKTPGNQEPETNAGSNPEAPVILARDLPIEDRGFYDEYKHFSRFVAETSYGVYHPRGWCAISSHTGSQDALRVASGFSQMRVYDNETGRCFEPIRKPKIEGEER